MKVQGGGGSKGGVQNCVCGGTYVNYRWKTRVKKLTAKGTLRWTSKVMYSLKCEACSQFRQGTTDTANHSTSTEMGGGIIGLQGDTDADLGDYAIISSEEGNRQTEGISDNAG